MGRDTILFRRSMIDLQTSILAYPESKLWSSARDLAETVERLERENFRWKTR
jgi:hypothetical protein